MSGLPLLLSIQSHNQHRDYFKSQRFVCFFFKADPVIGQYQNGFTALFLF
jgi:hypothetical protein